MTPFSKKGIQLIVDGTDPSCSRKSWRSRLNITRKKAFML